MLKTIPTLLPNIAILYVNAQESVSERHSEMSSGQNVCTADPGRAVGSDVLQLEGRKFRYLPGDLLI